jgi:hypothetical protein
MAFGPLVNMPQRIEAFEINCGCIAYSAVFWVC